MSDRPGYEREEIFLSVCCYCGTILNSDEVQELIGSKKNSSCYTLRTTHAICPDCLLENFPNEYASIQQCSTTSTKNISRKSSTFLDEKVSDKS